MLPAAADRPKLLAVLEPLSAAVEDLLLSGLTTATDATRQTLSAAMQEAARFRLLRLGSTLRAAVEELGRFTKHDPAFSRRRLAFFLNRGWLLSRGLAHALHTTNEAEYDRLNWSPPMQSLAEIEVVCLGTVKKVTTAAVLFEFRLRAIKSGQRLTWSAVFPVKAGSDILPEGFLHLPQKQKFTASVFLDKRILTIRNVVLSSDGRLSLTDQSTVATGEPFTDWSRFLDWSPEPAIDRLAKHTAGPLDLENELQEEVIVRDYKINTCTDGDETGQTAYPITTDKLTFHAVVGAGVEGKALKKSLDELRKAKAERPPLYGLMHYERCRLVLQPLTTFGKDGPTYLTISGENINKAALLKAMSFT